MGSNDGEWVSASSVHARCTTSRRGVAGQVNVHLESILFVTHVQAMYCSREPGETTGVACMHVEAARVLQAVLAESAHLRRLRNGKDQAFLGTHAVPDGSSTLN